MVDPAARLTAEQALAHPFFRLYQKEDVRLFSPRKTFRVSSGRMLLRTFTQVLYFTLFYFLATLYFYFTTFQREMLYFLLQYIYLAALVTLQIYIFVHKT